MCLRISTFSFVIVNILTTQGQSKLICSITFLIFFVLYLLVFIQNLANYDHWRTLQETKYNTVATSLSALRWMCESPRMGCARRIAPIYMWREQAIMLWALCVISFVACWHSVKICVHAAREFRSQQYKWQLCKCRLKATFNRDGLKQKSFASEFCLQKRKTLQLWSTSFIRHFLNHLAQPLHLRPIFAVRLTVTHLNLCGGCSK